MKQNNSSENDILLTPEQAKSIYEHEEQQELKDDAVFRSRLLKVLEKICENLGNTSKNEYADLLNDKDIADEYSYLIPKK